MEIKEITPIVIFDDQCYLCEKFAKMVNFLARGNLTIIGHYSSHGEQIRRNFLDESALDMFWLINEETAFGGRAALFPLINAILTSKKKKAPIMKTKINCEQNCKTAKSVFVRSASLLSNSKKIDLK